MQLTPKKGILKKPAEGGDVSAEAAVQVNPPPRKHVKEDWSADVSDDKWIFEFTQLGLY